MQNDIEGLESVAANVRQLITRGSEDSLARAIEISTEQLDLSFGRVESGLLLSLRGSALVRRYELSRRLAHLTSGIRDLEQALANESLATPQRLQTHSTYAQALVRAGEQTEDVPLLRRALVQFESLVSQRGPLSHSERMACAIGLLRIGAKTGDRRAVEQSIADLKTLISETDSDDPLTASLTVNLAAALLENARQNRNARVYRELIKTIGDRLDKDSENAMTLLQLSGTARQELSELDADESQVHFALEDFQAALTSQGKVSLASLEILHSLAQCCFRLGRIKRERQWIQHAIDWIGQAIALVEAAHDEERSRLVRLLAARAAYRFAYAVLSDRAKLNARLDEAALDYERAMAGVLAARAPAFFATIALGLFVLRCRQKQWLQALEVFVQVERAWDIAAVDRELSHTTQIQRTHELAGQYARAAVCCLALRRHADAALMTDRGRARQLRTETTTNSESTTNADGQVALNAAVNQWEHARRELDENSCRSAWQNLLDTRRRLGLHADNQHQTPADLFACVPETGLVVQIVATDAEVFTLAFNRQGLIAEPQRLANAHPSVSTLFKVSDKASTNWSIEYERFHHESADDEQTRFHCWQQAVNSAQSILGKALMQPIHDMLVRQHVGKTTSILLSPTGEVASLPLLTATLGDGSAFNKHWNCSIIPAVLDCDPAKVSASTNRGSDKVESLVVSAPSRHWSDAARLPGAAAEGKFVAELLAKHPARHLTGDDANIANVLDSIESASLVHFSVHGSYNPARPSESGVTLAHGKRLSMARLFSAGNRSPVRLVVFSCCESGIAGRSFPNDEFVGLLPTMLCLGAQAVIGTLWAVYDDSARIFTQRFFQTLLDDTGQIAKPPAQALGETQAWLRQVSLQELIDNHYVDDSQANEICDARFETTRLRLNRPVTEPSGTADTNRPANARHLAPFASPVDWAAYIIMGN